jgi:long-chain acyl-CoA synthetase
LLICQLIITSTATDTWHAKSSSMTRSSSSNSDTAPIWSTVVEGTARHDRGEIRRCWDPVVHPELGVHGCRTLYEGFRRGCRLNPLGPCMGYRAVSTTGFATPFIYTSYTECLARVDAVAAGLDRLNLLAPNDDQMKVIGLYAKNCMEWVITEHAAYSIGGVTAPFYDTLGPDTVQFILAQTGAKSVLSSRSELDALCQAKRGGMCPTFTHVILIDGVTQHAADRAQEAGLELVSFARVEAVGAEHIATTGGHDHTPPSPDDVATFCYTSGTTGNPKGALLTHQNLVSTVAGILRSVHDFEPHIYDRHLSYLPLAHIMERVGMANILMAGASVAFYRGDTNLLIEDLQACRPTLLPVAPRVLNKIHDKVRARHPEPFMTS